MEHVIAEPIKIEVDATLADSFAAVVLDKLKELDIDISQKEEQRKLAEIALKHVIDKKARMQATYESLMRGRLRDNILDVLNDKYSTSSEEVQHVQVSIDDESKTARISTEVSVPVDQQDKGRFWRAKNFLGWRVYTRGYLDDNKVFLSLSNFVELTGENDPDEKKSLESSISNALSTISSRKSIGSIKIKGFPGRFYGSLSSFENQWPIESALVELKERLGREIELVDVNYPIEDTMELVEYNEAGSTTNTDGLFE